MRKTKKAISENRACRWWNTVTIAMIAVILAFVAAYTEYIDPCFHYHAPLTNLFYPLSSQRYQNNGIAKYFDYDAMIVGTSMTENFKTSEMDALFGCHAVKTSFSGAYMRELADQIQTAYDTGHDVKMIISTLDGYMLDVKDAEAYNPIYTYPTYLYDKNIFFGKNSKEIRFKPTVTRSLLTVILMVWSILSLSGVSEFLYFNF